MAFVCPICPQILFICINFAEAHMPFTSLLLLLRESPLLLCGLQQGIGIYAYMGSLGTTGDVRGVTMGVSGQKVVV